MPGTTSLGIPYPLQGETVNATSWQNMATVVDALFTQLDALRLLGTTRPTASVSSSGSVTAIASGTTTTQLYTIENWDNAGYATLGTNADRLTLDTGVFYGRFNCLVSPTNSAVNITLVRSSMLLNGIVIAGAETDPVESDNDPGGQVVSAIFVVGVAGSILTSQALFVGTGGTAFQASATLQVYKIRELLDQ